MFACELSSNAFFIRSFRSRPLCLIFFFILSLECFLQNKLNSLSVWCVFSFPPRRNEAAPVFHTRQSSSPVQTFSLILLLYRGLWERDPSQREAKCGQHLYRSEWQRTIERGTAPAAPAAAKEGNQRKEQMEWKTGRDMGGKHRRARWG